MKTITFFLLILQLVQAVVAFLPRPLTKEKISRWRVDQTTDVSFLTQHQPIAQAPLFQTLLQSQTSRSEVLKASRLSDPVKIIIAGAPASGKGTQCERIKERFGVVHLSTGDMLRAAVAAGTEVGKEAKGYMDAGRLVPDSTIIGVVSDFTPNTENCMSSSLTVDTARNRSKIVLNKKTVKQKDGCWMDSLVRRLKPKLWKMQALRPTAFCF
jgi:adenylate kinase